VADVAAAGDLAHRLVKDLSPPDRLALLVFGHFRFAAELDATCLGAVASFIGGVRIKSLSNSASPPRYGQHQATVCHGGGGPCVAERAEAGFPIDNRREGIQQVAGGSGQPVKLRSHHHIAGVKGKAVEHSAKLNTPLCHK
jgi:hypothetical protein